MTEPRRIQERFTEDTAAHELTIIREEGLYRHLRLQRPGTGACSFDIITWPGYLAFVGDMGDYVFSRTDDMFGFFGADGINPDYWREKVQAACDDGVSEFSEDVYRERVEEWRDEVIAGFADEYETTDEDNAGKRDEFTSAVEDELLDMSDSISEESAHARLNDFRFGDRIECGDSWEWDLRRFTRRYIWALYAITWAIGEYRKAIAPTATVGDVL